MQMTKTEQKLLALARANGGHYSVDTLYGRGAQGGRVSAGKRDRDAMFKLEAKGLIKITSRQPWQDYNHGYGQGGTSFSFSIV